MSVFQNNLLFVNNGQNAPKPPSSLNTGGTSKGDPNAGSAGTNTSDPNATLSPITTADKAGAWILTVLVMVATIGLTGWVIFLD